MGQFTIYLAFYLLYAERAKIKYFEKKKDKKSNDVPALKGSAVISEEIGVITFVIITGLF